MKQHSLCAESLFLCYYTKQP